MDYIIMKIGSITSIIILLLFILLYIKAIISNNNKYFTWYTSAELVVASVICWVCLTSPRVALMIGYYIIISIVAILLYIIFMSRR